MKLNEILTDRNEVFRVLWDMGIRDADTFSIDKNGAVHFEDLMMDGPDYKFKELPFQIASVAGNLDMDEIGLTTLKGCPKEVGGYFSVNRNKLTSLEYAPSVVGSSVQIIQNSITSLVGIEKIFKRIGYKGGGKLFFDSHKITSGGIGLILIEGLFKLEEGEATGGKISRPFQIIEGYLGKPDDLYECQSELIEEGFEEYAQL